MKTSIDIIGRSNCNNGANIAWQNYKQPLIWHQFWRSLIAVSVGRSEPQIKKLSDSNWRVFDPISTQVLHFSTEQEVRIWLDQRYSF